MSGEWPRSCHLTRRINELHLPPQALFPVDKEPGFSQGALIPGDPIFLRFPLPPQDFPHVMVLQAVRCFEQVVGDWPCLTCPQGRAPQEGNGRPQTIVTFSLLTAEELLVCVEAPPCPVLHFTDDGPGALMKVTGDPDTVMITSGPWLLTVWVPMVKEPPSATLQSTIVFLQFIANPRSANLATTLWRHCWIHVGLDHLVNGLPYARGEEGGRVRGTLSHPVGLVHMQRLLSERHSEAPEPLSTAATRVPPKGGCPRPFP